MVRLVPTPRGPLYPTLSYKDLPHPLAFRCAAFETLTGMPAGPLGEVRGHGLARDHRPALIRRTRARLLHAHARHGRALARLRVRRALLRGALEPMREPDPPVGHRRPEGQVPARPRRRAQSRQPRDERAWERERRREHDAPRE